MAIKPSSIHCLMLYRNWMVSFSKPNLTCKSSLKALEAEVFAMIKEIMTHKKSRIPPDVFEEKNFLNTDRLILSVI